MCHLRDISWPCRCRDGDTKTKDKSSNHKDGQILCRRLNTRPKNDNQRSDEHPIPPFCPKISPIPLLTNPSSQHQHTSKISRRPRSKRPTKIANRMNRMHNPRRRCPSIKRKTEISMVLRIAIDSCHKRAIVSINAGIECCDEETYVFYHEHSPGKKTRFLGSCCVAESDVTDELCFGRFRAVDMLVVR